tara:strand:+ start:83 stop:1150 length:1068 start_codon:yes stop_codon:yes gene_type:complete
MISGMIWAGLACGMAAGGDSLSIDGYEFALIGDPGNRDTNEFEVPFFPDERIGGVDSEYHMATTEVSVGQYFEFVEAYYPFYVKNTGSDIGFTWFTGLGIRAAFGQVHILDGISPHRVADMSWEYAARYIKWLHHGKVNEEWAFNTGVYDASTFAQDDDGNWQHQLQRSSRARFFMPTLDKWTKGAHWDPNKGGGVGGYWRFPNGSNIESQPGHPDEGGERNAGESPAFPIGVGSYPDVKSPWGMLDKAGGQSEMTETARRSSFPEVRRLCGSAFFNDSFGDPFLADQLGFAREQSWYPSEGLRLATLSPSHSADLNLDGRIDFFDISFFAQLFFSDDDRWDIDDIHVFLELMKM